MIYERDYIKRLIRDIARTLAKLLFNIDTVTPEVELLEDSAVKQTAFSLLESADAGNIAEAGALLRRMLEDDPGNSIGAGLAFYSHLNGKSDEFLRAHGFSREQIEDGLRLIAEICGMEGALPL